MCGIEVGQEIFFIHNHYWKKGDELPEIKVGIVFDNPQGLEDARGHSVRPKEHQNSRLATRWLNDKEVFVTKSAVYIALFDVIREKIRDHETGIEDLWKCYHAAEKQTEEDLKRGGLDDLS